MSMHVLDGNQMCCEVHGKLQKNIFLVHTMFGSAAFACAQFNWTDTLWLFVSVIRKINNEIIRHILLRHDIQLFCGLVLLFIGQP